MKKVRVGLLSIVVIVLGILVAYFLLQKDTHLITFDSNGGSIVSSVKVKNGSFITKPDDPTKEGYTFVGWYIEDKLFDFNTPIKEDTKLVAKWAVKENPDICTLVCDEGYELVNADSKDCSCLKQEDTPKVVEVTGVELNKSSVTLKEGEKTTLTAKVNPEDATNKNVTWKSSNTKVATVKDGVISAVKAGSAVVTVTTVDGSKTASLTVYVNAKDSSSTEEVKVTGVELNKSSVTMTVGDTETLAATIKPSTASNKEVTWKSSDTAVVKVENGKLTALKAGSATVTVTTNDGNKKAQATVTVNPKKYTVKFNSNGGSSVDDQIVNDGSKATKPTDPTRLGYTFAGWTLKGSSYNFNSPVTEDVTLLATWTVKNYTVSFNSAGGSSVTSQTIQEGSKATKPTDPTRLGYTFAGWTLGGSSYNFNSPVMGDIALEATWNERGYTYSVGTCSPDIGLGQKCLIIYHNGIKVTNSASTFVANSNNNWLGDFNNSEQMVVLNESKLGSVSKIYINSAYHALTVD